MSPAPPSIFPRYDAATIAEFEAAGWWRRENLAEWVRQTANAHPDRTAVAGSGTVLSYRELWEGALRLSRGLETLGVEPGKVVAVQLPNCVEFVLAYLATAIRGATLQTVHVPYREAELAGLLSHSGATVVIALTSLRDYRPASDLVALKERIQTLQHVVSVGGPTPGAITFETLLQSNLPQQSNLVASDAALILLYTSGTTSAPKGVPIRAEAFLGNARMVATELQVSAADRILSAAPFTHLYGLMTLHLTFAAGATACLLPLYSPDGLAGALVGLQPTALFTAPPHLATGLQQGLLDRSHLQGLRFVVVSGSRCPESLAAEVQHLLDDGKLLQLWGMSELQVGTFSRLDDPQQARLSAVGRVSPGIEVRIVDGTGAICPADIEGELLVRGSSVFRGYLGNAAATASALTADGWFHTGDLATLDATGQLRLTGRLKDVINRGGVKFNPADIESLLETHPAVISAAIVPMPDPILGERACCFVVLKAGATVNLDDVRRFLDGHGVTKFKWPEHLEVVEAMPLTPTRKIMKSELIRRLPASLS
jgi:cyclohexanecarboxylate-CoA ligase/acyl-CoA synthetase